MKLDFSPDFLMMDSSTATYSAATKQFPATKILMCYFHLMQNVLKNCRELFKCDKSFDDFKESIYQLHMSKTQNEYSDRLLLFEEKYDKKITKKAFDYFNKQWVENHRFNKWQIFQSPPGYANTNSNIESFNRQIKGFTHKKKLTVFGMIDKCEEMVNYYSTLQGDRFNEFPKFNKKVNEMALKLDKSLFKKISMNNYRYKSWIINKNEKCCSCRGFLKHAICQHSLGFSHLKNLQWFGPKYTNRSDEFVFKNKIGRKKGGRYKNALPALESDED